MPETGTREVSVLEEFQSFCAEIIRTREAARAHAATVAVSSPDPNTPDEFAVQSWQRLAGMLERQALLVGRAGGELSFSLYREAQYVMASLADEFFVHLEWEGRTYWTRHLLETQLFGSNVAGEAFFANLDSLLDQPERAYSDIYSIYLYALALGFRGKYWGTDDGGAIDHYRRMLFQRIYGHQADLSTEGKRLFPETYIALRHALAARLPSPGTWLEYLAIAVVCWLLVTHVVWNSIIGELEQKTDAIAAISASKGVQPHATTGTR